MTPAPGVWDEIATREVPARTLATVQAQLHQHDVASFIPAAFGRLFAFSAAHGGLRPAATTPEHPTYALYHGTFGFDTPTLVEVCVVIDRAVASEGDITVRVEPAHSEAYLPLTRRRLALPSLTAAYDDLGEWVAHHGRMLSSSPPREVYIADVMAASDDTHVGDVAFPYAPRAAG